jgi:polyferredoxin
MFKRLVQIAASLFMNSYFVGFFRGQIYQGPTKQVCVPILNCWGCPGARFGCPAGGIQHFIGLKLIPFAVIGFYSITGIIVGRMACGWICPFGLFQDLLYKLRTFKIKMPKFFKYLKYVMLVGVVGVVVYITGEPWFCKLCPDGLLIAGIPLVLADRTGDLRALTGWHYYMKIGILMLIILLSISTKRFFCRVLCPVGAIYSIFNRFSVFRIKVDRDKCIECGSCKSVCPMDIHIQRSPHNIDCIRCLDCVRKCPTRALTYGIQ